MTAVLFFATSGADGELHLAIQVGYPKNREEQTKIRDVLTAAVPGYQVSTSVVEFLTAEDAVNACITQLYNVVDFLNKKEREEKL